MEFSSGSSDEEEVGPPVTVKATPIGATHPIAGTTFATPGIRNAKREAEEHDVHESGKKKRIVKSAEAAAATPRKAMDVPTDEHGRPTLPITVGMVTLYSAGVIADQPNFHNKRYIWPIGFHSTRPYMSAIDVDAQTVYHSRILDGPNGPIFDVYAEDNPDQHYQSPTPTGAWTAIVKQVNAIRGRDYSNSASGPDFFGLSNPTIGLLIEKLPGSDKCTQYQRKTYETVPGLPPRPVRPPSDPNDNNHEGDSHMDEEELNVDFDE